MDSEARTARSAGDSTSLFLQLSTWFLLEGDRRIVAALLTLTGIGLLWMLIVIDAVAVGPKSSVATLFGSGLTAGVVTLLTIALSINQLILSRVFGSPDQLRSRLDGAREARRGVANLAGQPSSPNDPAAFLSLLGTTLQDRAEAAVAATGRDTPSEVTDALDDIAAYGASIDAQVQPQTQVSNILGVIIGPEYAVNMTATRHLLNRYEAELSPKATVELEAVADLLEYVAILRQFFKTMAIQQDFALLSRLLVYTGLVGFLISVAVTLVYSTDAATLTEPTLAVVIPVAVGLVGAPLALFAAFILRAASVAYRTVSVGPFIPPSGQ